MKTKAEIEAVLEEQIACLKEREAAYLTAERALRRQAKVVGALKRKLRDYQHHLYWSNVTVQPWPMEIVRLITDYCGIAEKLYTEGRHVPAAHPASDAGGPPHQARAHVSERRKVQTMGDPVAENQQGHVVGREAKVEDVRGRRFARGHGAQVRRRSWGRTGSLRLTWQTRHPKPECCGR